MVKMSAEEAEWLLGVSAADAMAHPARVRELLKGQCLVLLVTGGASGSAFSFLDVEGLVPAFKTQVVDTTGAGDSYMAAFLHSLLTHDIDWAKFGTEVALEKRSRLVREIARFAAAAAALTCSGAGAIDPQPSARAVNGFLLAHGGNYDLQSN